MARIAGVDLPNKHVNIALTYIYGIGRSSANEICKKTKINPDVLMETDEELAQYDNLQLEVGGKLFCKVMEKKESGWLLHFTSKPSGLDVMN